MHEAVEITGALRWPDERHWFTPADDISHNLWFARDPAQLRCRPKGSGPANEASRRFMSNRKRRRRPAVYRSPGKLVVALPDNHLQYAVTWYGLAAVLAAVFGGLAFIRARPNADARQSRSRQTRCKPSSAGPRRFARLPALCLACEAVRFAISVTAFRRCAAAATRLAWQINLPYQ